MKILVGQYRETSYSFNPTLKTITLSGFADNIKLEQILMITNTTTGTIIFSPQMTLLGSINSNIITLSYDTTSGMNSSDSLQILIEINVADNEELTDILKYGLVEIVRQLQSMRNDGGIPDVLGRVRCAVEVLPTLSTVTTVGTLTNQAQAGGFALQQEVMSLSNQAWGNLRSRITVS